MPACSCDSRRSSTPRGSPTRRRVSRGSSWIRTRARSWPGPPCPATTPTITSIRPRTAPELFADPIVSQVYEPGSVMKMFTAAAALEEGVVNLNTPVADGRVLRIGPDEVRNGDLDSIGTVPFQDIIARSRNVGVGKGRAESRKHHGRRAQSSFMTCGRGWALVARPESSWETNRRASSPTHWRRRGRRSTSSTAPSDRALR